MLSYRHAFHTGNHVDVLKHTILLETLSYLKRKDKGWYYLDTHAGAGCYSLASDTSAGQLAEYQAGAARIWTADDLPEALAAYREALLPFNPDGELEVYPGSPALAMQAARPQDRLRLFELHPADFQALGETFANDTARVQCRRSDGFQGLTALLPPPTRRAVVLIDPSYEVKDDYRRVVDSLHEALERFPQGSYLLWYPLLDRPEVRQLGSQLQKLAQDLPAWLHARLQVRRAQRGQYGMYGSGMFVINPPWVLPARLEAALAWLAKELGEDEGAGFELDHQIH